MYLFHLFRSFLPLHNPIGFGAADFVELGLLLLLLLPVLARPWVVPVAEKLAARTGWCMILLFALVLVLRVALLPRHPVPTPSGADDFSFVLLGDTLAHFRLANPPHAMAQFFETTFVIQHPSYASIYPLGQGFALALGQLVFGLPWAGVLISMALIPALCFWMLRGWTSPGWALAGGLLAVCLFGPLNSWMNTYWGGPVSAVAGCMVYGALPRIRQRFSARDSVLLGIGIGLQMLTRPYESLFLDASVVLFFLPELRRAEWRRLVKAAVPAVFAVLPLVGLQLLHNHAVTGSWMTLPYQLSRYQYGVPTTFTFQPNAVPHAELTQAQQLYYEGQAMVHGPTDTVAGYLERFGSRAGFYRFFFFAPMLLALVFFVPLLREYRYRWIALTCLLFAVGTNFYPYFFPQYVAAATCLFVLAAILGFERLAQWKPGGQVAARWLLILCGAQFVFWYGIHAQSDEGIFRAMVRYETGDGVNYGDLQGRIAINRMLDTAPGRQLVFVRYLSTHGYAEWIHNAADIDRARVVWALDRGTADNDRLKAYYPDRKVWLMLPDAIPPRLIPYPAMHGPFEDVQ